MEWFEQLSKEDVYLAKVIFPQIKQWDYNKDGVAVISAWREGTPEEVKEKAKSYDYLIIKAKQALAFAGAFLFDLSTS